MYPRSVVMGEYSCPISRVSLGSFISSTTIPFSRRRVRRYSMASADNSAACSFSLNQALFTSTLLFSTAKKASNASTESTERTKFDFALYLYISKIYCGNNAPVNIRIKNRRTSTEVIKRTLTVLKTPCLRNQCATSPGITHPTACSSTVVPPISICKK